MTIFQREMRANRLSLLLWTGAVAGLLALCILIYPEMAPQMDAVSRTFSQMGGFSAAFGMDRISFGEFLGFFAVECGSILGLGGGLFAALTGVSALSREEQDRTAAFLLTHPVSRSRAVGEKLLAAAVQVSVFHLLTAGTALLSIAAIGEKPEARPLALLFLAYLLLELELMAICLGVSAFLRRGGPGIGLGLALGLYFLSIIANLTEGAAFLKYLTPFSYANAADIVTSGALEGNYLAVGAAFAAIGVFSAFWRYSRKDIAD